MNIITPQMCEAVQGIWKMPDGYALHLSATQEILMLVAEDPNRERL